MAPGERVVVRDYIHGPYAELDPGGGGGGGESQQTRFLLSDRSSYHYHTQHGT